MSFMTSALIVTWIALLLLAFVVSGLVRQVHALSAGTTHRPRAVGPRAGGPAPGLEPLATELPAMLLFLSPGCRTCGDVLDEAAASATGMSLHALYPGPVPDRPVPPRVTVHGGQDRLFATYDAVATPFAVVVGADGRVARSGPVGSRAALGDLLVGRVT